MNDKYSYTQTYYTQLRKFNIRICMLRLAVAVFVVTLVLFTLRQLSEKYTDFSKDLYVCYIDFRKAFDSIWREGLWRVMRNMGYPEKIVRILESLYRGTFSAVRIGADITEWFETIVGVLQGCMLSPLLFNIFLEIIMAMAIKDVDAGAVISGYVIR